MLLEMADDVASTGIKDGDLVLRLVQNKEGVVGLSRQVLPGGR